MRKVLVRFIVKFGVTALFIAGMGWCGASNCFTSLDQNLKVMVVLNIGTVISALIAFKDACILDDYLTERAALKNAEKEEKELKAISMSEYTAVGLNTKRKVG
jgi:hypothetical protein